MNDKQENTLNMIGTVLEALDEHADDLTRTPGFALKREELRTIYNDIIAANRSAIHHINGFSTDQAVLNTNGQRSSQVLNSSEQTNGKDTSMVEKFEPLLVETLEPLFEKSREVIAVIDSITKGIMTLSERSIQEHLQARDVAIKQQLAQLRDSMLRQVDSEKYAQSIDSNYAIRCPQLHLDSKTARPRKVPTTGRNGITVFIEVVDYSIPFSGDPEVFGLAPRSFSNYGLDYRIEGNNLVFTVHTQGIVSNSLQLQQDVKQHARKAVQYIESSLAQLRQEIDLYNSELEGKIIGWLDELKKPLKKRDDTADNLADL